jgi:eukaryotic-like serine/threonine-protein kinase
VTPSEKYRIVRRIGNQQKRKFSDVFLAEDKHTGERCVLKVLARSETNTVLQERLQQEATFDFDHPQLPRTLDFYTSDTELILARSYTDGVPLDAFMKTIRQKDKPSLLSRFIDQLQPVFDELKRLQIVHLDLKPSNFIIAGTPDHFTVSLIDFGMAMRTTEREKRSTLFPLGYAAPELLLNRLHLADQRTDLFSLGIVLWQQFTGKLPLLHPNPGITTNLQLTHPLPEHDLIPRAFFPILRRLCEKHVFAVPPNQLPEAETDLLLLQAMDRRYGDLREVLEDWQSALSQPKGFFAIFRR